MYDINTLIRTQIIILHVQSTKNHVITSPPPHHSIIGFSSKHYELKSFKILIKQIISFITTIDSQRIDI